MIYSLAVAPPNFGIGAICDFKAAAVSRPRVLEVTVVLGTGAAGVVYGIGRAVAELSQVGALALKAEDSGDPDSNSTVATAWSAAPAAPAQFFRRVAMQTSQQAGGIHTFPRGLHVAPSTSLLVWCLVGTTVATPSISWQVDE